VLDNLMGNSAAVVNALANHAVEIGFNHGCIRIKKPLKKI